jgi:hypothetical protein
MAAKIVRTTGKIILKLTRAVWELIELDELWEKSATAPVLARARAQAFTT